MKNIALCFVGIALLVTGCSAPFQGIRLRVQAPPLEEGFRKVSLAVSVDGYETEMVLPEQYQLTTRWREAQEKEIAPKDRTVGAARIDCKLILQMEPRGRLYDVLCTPWLRHSLPDGTVRESIADATHPLRQKWEEVFRRLLEREAKEED